MSNLRQALSATLSAMAAFGAIHGNLSAKAKFGAEIQSLQSALNNRTKGGPAHTVRTGVAASKRAAIKRNNIRKHKVT